MSLFYEKVKNISLIYSSSTKKWAESKIDLLGVEGEYAILSDGIYTLSSDYSSDYYELILKTPYFEPKKPDLHTRAVLNSVILDITQGKATADFSEKCQLQLSKDNVVFSKRVTRPLSKTGNRLFQFRWYMNYVNSGFSLRFTLQVRRDITIKALYVDIN